MLLEKFRFLKPYKTIILCGKQCIVLRGHRKDIRNSGSNFGNFLAILKLLSEANSNLNLYLDKTLPTCFLGFKMSYLQIISCDILLKRFDGRGDGR